MKKLILFLILVLLSTQSWALEIVPYKEAEIIKANKLGSPYAIHFYAEWCIICQQQKFMINELKKDDSFNKITVYTADFDFEKALKEKNKVERQSTLIIFRDGAEIDRSLGVKDKEKLSTFFKKSL